MTVLPMIVLILSSILLAMTNVTLRHLKVLSILTPTVYYALGSAVACGINFIVLSERGMGLTMLPHFEALDYFLFILVSLMGICALLFKTKALQIEMASRVSIISYL